jgi:hypothetical protein
MRTNASSFVFHFNITSYRIYNSNNLILVQLEQSLIAARFDKEALTRI